eukprot:1150324-Pelagomonas_calceolata.AAC.1
MVFPEGWVFSKLLCTAWFLCHLMGQVSQGQVRPVAVETLAKLELRSPIKERSSVLKGRAPTHRPRGRASTEVYS